MGTSIDIILPRPPGLDTVTITFCLNITFERCDSSLQVIKEHAWYSFHCDPWNVEFVPATESDPEFFQCEGPYGFDISVYENTICLGHLERFGRIHYDDSPVAIALQRIMTAVIEDLAGAVPFACIAGGMGDSDKAIDLAYYQARLFQDVANFLNEFLGEPAKTWQQLNFGPHRWALIG